MRLEPVGRVVNGISSHPVEGWRGIESVIEVRRPYWQALEGLEDFSCVMVLFWFDRTSAEGRSTLAVHPQGRKDVPRVGVFATRSPARPNPLGVTVCRMLHVSEGELRVRGLDAFDGTPVVDLKGYGGEEAKPDRVPDWLMQLWSER